MSLTGKFALIRTGVAGPGRWLGDLCGISHAGPLPITASRSHGRRERHFGPRRAAAVIEGLLQEGRGKQSHRSQSVSGADSCSHAPWPR
jgi:hypothetical protein